MPPDHLVTHGVVLGMTGSGKTGLTLGLVEEALAARVPVLMIDIKGDLGNLFFSLGDAAGPAFLPWIDADAAARAGKTAEAVAEEAASRYRTGLESGGSSVEEARARRAAMRPRIITPGASFGEQLDVLSSLSTPSPLWKEDASAARDQLAAAVSLVLQLAGREGDVRSRAHVVLSTLAERRLASGATATLTELLRDVLAPPISVVGAMGFDEFFPAKDQQSLAQDLNTLVASPKLATWLQGTPLDVASWLKLPADGATPAVLVTVAHLDDEERALVLGLLLDEVLTWVRGLSGTSDLRALVVFDEVFGFLPPAPRDPPTKKPILALLKQARAFGVGVLLATQNPMDVDYKALSNAGAWFVGRLQTDADRERVVDGLVGADGGTGGLTPQEIGAILKNLPPRTFFVRDVHRKPACALLETRTVSSWLRGPMTRREIARLHLELGGRPALLPSAPAPRQAGAGPVADGASSPTAAEPTAPAKTVPGTPIAAATGAPTVPALPSMWRSFFGRVPDGVSAPRFVPYVAGTVALRVRDTKLGLVLERKHAVIVAFDAAGRPDLGRASFVDPKNLEGPEPRAGVFDALPAGITSKKSAQAIERTLRDHVATACPLLVDVHRDLGVFRGEDESKDAFAARCRAEAEQQAADEQRLIAAKYAPELAKLQDKLGSAQRELAVAQQSMSSAPSDLGAAFIGLALGRSAGNKLSKSRDRAEVSLTRASSAVAKADAALRAKLAQRDTELAAALDLARRGASAITTERLVPKKGDTELVAIGIAWSPTG